MLGWMILYIQKIARNGRALSLAKNQAIQLAMTKACIKKEVPQTLFVKCSVQSAVWASLRRQSKRGIIVPGFADSSNICN